MWIAVDNALEFGENRTVPLQKGQIDEPLPSECDKIKNVWRR